MTIETEPRPTQKPWGEIELTPEIDTDQKRLNALLNILQNGAQTLTVLTMPPDTRQWQGYRQIWRQLNESVGYKVLRDNRTTKNHLIACIEPVGAAARSSPDDLNWALTGFGIKIKAPLISAWQKLRGLNLDAMQILASQSRGKKDQAGNLVTTAALVRCQILLALAEQELREVDLRRTSGLRTSILNHLGQLQAAGLVDYQNADTQRGQSVTVFGLTQKGRQTATWPTYKVRKWSLPGRSAQVAQAVKTLQNQNQPITVDAVSLLLTKEAELSAKNPARQTNHAILSFFARQGLLQRIKFARSDFSRIWATPLGKQVAGQILAPLAAWAEDSQSVPEIAQIESRLKINPHAESRLYPSIAESYEKHSPKKNADPEAKIRQILAQVQKRPGQLTASDLARQMKLSESTVRLLLEPLIDSGQISRQKAVKGGRLLLAPGPNMADFDR